MVDGDKPRLRDRVASAIPEINLMQRIQAMRDRRAEREPKKHTFIKWLIGVLILLGVVGWYLFIFTDLGYQILNISEKEDPLGKAEEKLDEGGFSHQLRVISDILTGKFEPEGLWTSETVQSEYSVPEEFELVIKDVEPLKSSFKTGEDVEDIVVIGRINLISGFDKTTTVELDVSPDKLCTKSSGRGDCTADKEWTCIISGTDPEKDEPGTFKMEKIYNRQFSCSHVGITGKLERTEVISGIKVKWRYSTSAVAGKQIYAFNTNVLDKYEDVLERYDVTDENLESWYIGDDNVNLGIGLKSEKIRAEATRIAKSYIGITIQNTGSGAITDIESLSISFPDTDGIHVADQIQQEEAGSESIFKGPTTEVLTIKGKDIITKKFTLSEKEIKDFDKVEPADHVVYYIPFLVTEEYVGESDFRSFLVKADVRYKYEKYDTVAVEVK